MPRLKKPLYGAVESIYNTRAIPEHKLWVSVLDRAVMDYTMFFDYVTTKMRNTNSNSKMRRNARNGMMRELDSLRWFFFEENILPYNLAWIADLCFDSDSDFLDKVRKRVQEKHYSNLMQYERYPEFELLIQQYKELGYATKLVKVEPHKKFRLRVDFLH